MKLITLIAVFLLITLAFSKVTERKKSLSRTVNPETVALELEFAGTCTEFNNRVLGSVTVSSHTSCLPILTGVSSNPDNNDLNADYFCSNVDDTRSLIHFVEIYQTSDATPSPNFVLSLIPSNPIRVLTTGVTVQRRPDCMTTQDYCNSTNYVVNGCTTNQVTYARRTPHGRQNWVINADRIYFSAGGQTSNDCRDTTTACCAYVSPTSFGGVCDNIASRDLLAFPTRTAAPNSYANTNANTNSYANTNANTNSYGNSNANTNSYGNDEEEEDGNNGHSGSRPQQNSYARPQGNGYSNNQEEGRPWDKKNVVEVTTKKTN